MELRTYNDLLRALQNCSKEQLEQPIQCIKPGPIQDKVQECLPGISIDTVKNFGFYRIRSTHNNKYCPSDLVILLDGNPFGESGEIAYELGPDADFDNLTPIYGKDGKTSIEDQTAPEYRCGETYTAEILKKRIEEYEGD